MAGVAKELKKELKKLQAHHLHGSLRGMLPYAPSMLICTLHV
jgi:hypothetical protein